MNTVMLVFIIAAGSQDVWDVIVVLAILMDKKLCRSYTTQLCKALGKTTALATNQITLLDVKVVKAKNPHLETCTFELYQQTTFFLMSGMNLGSNCST